MTPVIPKAIKSINQSIIYLKYGNIAISMKINLSFEGLETTQTSHDAAPEKN